MSTASDTTTTQKCRVCRTENDVFYTYCRRCLAELPSRPTGSESAVL